MILQAWFQPFERLDVSSETYMELADLASSAAADEGLSNCEKKPLWMSVCLNSIWIKMRKKNIFLPPLALI